MTVYINDSSFSYDVYSLVKAFYPEEDIKVLEFSEGPDAFSFSIFEEVISVADEGLERKDYKNKIKRAIYNYLSEKTGMVLPWGTLTGIRPTKLPMGMLYENKSDEEIKAFLENTYYVTGEKIDLSLDIAKREKKLLDSIDTENGYSLYVGIPFCPTTCMYCSFTSYPIARWRNQVDEYISMLKKEIDYVSESQKGKTLDTIYIGGGTPTTLEPDQIRDLISYIRGKLDLSQLKEFTVEAGRPDSITEDKLKALKEMDVTRISVNPQTMNDETLRLIGRAHSVEQFRNAFNLARGYFDNINTDLILGLPGENDDMVKYTFDEIVKLSPDSVTVHAMAIKRAAHMKDFLTNNPHIKSEITDEMMRLLYDMADSLNMKPYYLYRQKNMTGNYENTGFSREGKEGIYNILIMEEVQSIIACGAGTITKRVFPGNRIERCDNVKDVKLYIEKIDEMIDRKRQLFKD